MSLQGSSRTILAVSAVRAKYAERIHDTFSPALVK